MEVLLATILAVGFETKPKFKVAHSIMWVLFGCTSLSNMRDDNLHSGSESFIFHGAAFCWTPIHIYLGQMSLLNNLTRATIISCFFGFYAYCEIIRLPSDPTVIMKPVVFCVMTVFFSSRTMQLTS